MLRLALIGFLLVIGSLLALSFVPQAEDVIPNSEITLSNASLRLFPEADPASEWQFEASSIEYNPDSRYATLYDIEDAERRVEGEVDFRLDAERVVIDNADNLRAEELFVHVLDIDWDLHMQARGNRQVFINQASGKFEVPILTYTGEGIGESRDENVRMNFDLTNFEAGGPGTVGYNRLRDIVEE